MAAAYVRERDGAFVVYAEDGVEIDRFPTRDLADRKVAAVEKTLTQRTDAKGQTSIASGRLVYRQDFARGSEAVRLDKTQHIGAGGIIVDAVLSRSGVQSYPREDGSVSLEYEPPEEMRKSLDSYREIPVTIGHPPDFVDPDNYSDHNVGHVVGKPTFDGRLTRGKLALGRRDAIDGVTTDTLSEGSGGYTAWVEMTPGTTPEGERYDAIKRGRVMNHHAMGPKDWARGGPEIRVERDSKRRDSKEERMKIRIDGIDTECDEAAVKALLDRSEKAQAEAEKAQAEAQAKAEASASELAKAQDALKAATAPGTLADAVKDQLAFERDLGAVLSAEQIKALDGKTRAEMETAAILAVFPDRKVSDEARRDVFALAADQARKAAASLGQRGASGGGRADAMPAEDYRTVVNQGFAALSSK